MLAEFAKFAPTYVHGFSACFGMYGLQMLCLPEKMVTDHFDAPATPLLKFWIRGEAVSVLGMVYAISQVQIFFFCISRLHGVASMIIFVTLLRCQ